KYTRWIPLSVQMDVGGNRRIYMHLLCRSVMRTAVCEAVSREPGEGGIRTLGSLLSYGALAKRCFQPLSHLTKCRDSEYCEESTVSKLQFDCRHRVSGAGDFIERPMIVVPIHSRFDWVSGRLVRKKKAWLAWAHDLENEDVFSRSYRKRWWFRLGEALMR